MDDIRIWSKTAPFSFENGLLWTGPKCASLGPEKKEGPKLTHLAVEKFVQFRRSRVNARWNRARFYPCKNLSGPVVHVLRTTQIWSFHIVVLPAKEGKEMYNDL